MRVGSGARPRSWARASSPIYRTKGFPCSVTPYGLRPSGTPGASGGAVVGARALVCGAGGVSPCPWRAPVLTPCPGRACAGPGLSRASGSPHRLLDFPPLRFWVPGGNTLCAPLDPTARPCSAVLRRLASGLSLLGAGPSLQPPAGVGTPGRPKSSAADNSHDKSAHRLRRRGWWMLSR
jgi:hypothetical protein